MSDAARTPLAVIGLTGSIGAGKSTVAQMLTALGCVVSDSDALARVAYRDPSIREQVSAWWGTSILDAQGAVDRSKIASIIFASPSGSCDDRTRATQERLRLEALVHPFIASRREELFARASPKTVALVIDAPLLLESNMANTCDSIWMVDAPCAMRLERVSTTRGWSEAELSRREIAQMPLDLKRKLAHHVLINDGSVESLRAQVVRILKITIEEYRGKQRT